MVLDDGIVQLLDLIASFRPFDREGLDTHPEDHDLVQRVGPNEGAQDHVLACLPLLFCEWLVVRLKMLIIHHKQERLVIFRLLEQL